MNARRLEAWEFAQNDGPFRAAAVPCTVAGLLRDRGEWALGEPADFDAEHWTFRCQVAGGAENLLVCDGLTPGAQIFLNGTLLATADNMFRALRLPVALDVDNLIEIRFSPLLHPQRKPRPRWRTQLVDQQWRWYRTTALGHMPSWGPLYATVGPWRSIRLGRRTVDDVCLDVTVDGTTGLVTWSGRPIDVSRDSLLLAGVILIVVYMAQIRRKLEPEPASPRYFITEPGMGYRFEPGDR